MIDRDLFVGLVSIGAGIFVLAGSLFRHEDMLKGTVPAAVAALLGPVPARCLLAATGVVFVGIGIMIIRPVLARAPRGPVGEKSAIEQAQRKGPPETGVSRAGCCDVRC